jgi:predicted TIM-barrel fold metal-dependent hydrolase
MIAPRVMKGKAIILSCQIKINCSEYVHYLSLLFAARMRSALRARKTEYRHTDMIIDAHTHIFSDDVRLNRDRYLADGQFRRLYGSDKAKLIDHRDLMAAMKESGIDYAVAMGFSWEREELCAAQNQYFQSVAELSGRTIIPFGSVPINNSTDVGAWVRGIRESGLRGVGEVAFYRHGMNEEAIGFLRRLFAAVRDNSLPLCLHVSEPVGHAYPGKYDPHFGELSALIADYPDVAVLLSHWGGGLLFYELMPEVSKILANCSYDTAASPFLYDDGIYGTALKITGSKKILFGSDYPLLPYRRYLDSINGTIADENMRADILGLNAARTLKII